MVLETVPKSGPPRARVFISYSRKDMAFANRLDAALKARGFEPLIDRTEIYAFEDWWKRIVALIGRADTVVFVLSPDAVASKVALNEVAHAASLNKRFAPIVCRQVEDSAVPEPLRRLNFIFFDHPSRFEASADKLAEALQTDIGWIRQHTEFGESARRWTAAGRPGPRGLLLRSPVLEDAERWIKSHPRGAPEPTKDIRAFVDESRRAATRRKLRTLGMVGLITALAITGLAAWWYQNRLSEYAYWRTDVRGHVLSMAQERALKPKDVFKECVECPEMVVVPAGWFMMGAVETEPDPSPWKLPQHKVTILRSFAVSKFELTFDEWDACAAHGDCDPRVIDGGFGRGRQPAVNVSWKDAQQYVAWLSRITGQNYRLLSEAEYEYAARAGSQTAYPWGNALGQGNAECADCGSEWDGKPAPVGTFPSNQFGLYDMIGNVNEWVQDCFNENYDGAPMDGSSWTTGECANRVERGGSFRAYTNILTSASRQYDYINSKTDNLGFRVGRTIHD
jgi:formylglycine-generating enzyme required for sulfatase activity